MGVVFKSGDDVQELLIPFVVKHGGLNDALAIEEFYRQASLGMLSADQFWCNVNLSPDLEDEYLQLHATNEGLFEFLARSPASIESIWCLSNDVSRWSLKLRQRFCLAKHFAGFVISGDVGARKPDQPIFHALLDAVKRPAEYCILVDDRTKNLCTAAALKFRTIAFGHSATYSDHTAEAAVQSFSELAAYLS